MFENYDGEDYRETPENDDNKSHDVEDSYDIEEDYDNYEEESHFDEIGNLKSETEYDVNGYHYETDEQGRIACCSGTLRIENAERDPSAQREVGNEFRGKDENGRALDDGGHLIASRFGGSGEKDNLVAMDRTLNRSDYKIMENEWNNLMKDGYTVDVDIYCYYDTDTQRPDDIEVFYNVRDKDGNFHEDKSQHRIFHNKM